MNKLKAKIVDYYDDLKRQIDIQCEKLLSDPNIEEKLKDECKQTREIFLNEIDKCVVFNLSELKNVDQNHPDINSIIFDKRFCFYLSKKDMLESYSDKFALNNIGILVITNLFINSYILDEIKKSLNYIYTQQSLNVQETILSKLIGNLIEKKWPGTNSIIDLSSKEKNSIQSLEMYFNEDISFNDSDFDFIDKIIETKELESCLLNLIFKELNFVSKRHLSNFRHVNFLDLRLYYKDFEDGLFTIFDNLETLFIREAKLNKNSLIGLENLKKLRIILGCLNESPFEFLKNLKYLELDAVQINELREAFFRGTENLERLKMVGNQLNFINLDSFTRLKSLVSLDLNNAINQNTKIDALNELKSLEYLNLLNSVSFMDKIYLNLENLNLPKLKFLAFDSKKVPELKNLKLEFLQIFRIEELNENSFKFQHDLKGLLISVQPESFDLIKKENFIYLNNLFFLNIQMADLLNNPSLERDKIDKDYFKSFLLRSDTIFTYIYRYSFSFTVKVYEELDVFIEKEINASKLAKESLKNNLDYYLSWYE